jgi:hypothetical protein
VSDLRLLFEKPRLAGAIQIQPFAVKVARWQGEQSGLKGQVWSDAPNSSPIEMNGEKRGSNCA